MSTPSAGRPGDRAGERTPSLDDVQRATLNILEDLNIEKQRLEDVQHASLNILEDFGGEQRQLQQVQLATLNILEDFNAEKNRMEGVQRASLNILEDFEGEQRQLQEVQRATLNILDDFDAERAKTLAANQKLEVANKELEAFSYSVSHDLRAPLRAVDGFARMVLESYADKLDEEGQRQLRVIRDGAQKMGRLIDDLLGFSRMGRREMALANVDMAALARDVAEELRQLETARTIEIAIASLPATHGDPAMLRQVWTNLLANAIKFTRPRAPARVEVGGRSDGNENVYSVKDNGVGFNMEYANKLFGVFQRLHGPEEFEGTGVGLALVQRIVHRHGGRIWAEGKLGEGAMFSFALPNNNPA